MNSLQVNHCSPFSIGILICYYGELPWYFRFFLASCAYNTDIDFIFVSDIDIKEQLPPNVIVVKRTIQEIKKTAEQKLRFEVCLDKPFKLCDFRPAFAQLFSDLIEGYDFWGYGDIDIIYGRIRHFITDDILREYDAISTKPQYFTGFFALLKNTDKIKNIFRESKDYKKVFQSPYDHCFDEMNWHWLDLMQGRSIFEINAEVQSMTYIVQKLARNKEIKAYFSSLWCEERTEGILVWDRGVLTYDNEETMLYHFYKFKRQFFTFIPPWKIIPEKYYGHPFYFSRFSPGSIPGKIVNFALTKFKACHYYSARFIQYFQWLSKYVRASEKVKNNEIPFIQDLLGTYKSPPHNVIIDIKIIDNALCGQWLNNTIRLHHMKKNKFIVSKFSLGVNFDIDVRFYYDKEKSNYALAVCPHRFNKTILYKV
jgi:hypothetical protein